jgi:hypothetical protein
MGNGLRGTAWVNWRRWLAVATVLERVAVMEEIRGAYVTDDALAAINDSLVPLPLSRSSCPESVIMPWVERK